MIISVLLYVPKGWIKVLPSLCKTSWRWGHHQKEEVKERRSGVAPGYKDRKNLIADFG